MFRWRNVEIPYKRKRKRIILDILNPSPPFGILNRLKAQEMKVITKIISSNLRVISLTCVCPTTTEGEIGIRIEIKKIPRCGLSIISGVNKEKVIAIIGK
jgi:hypothetical protein